MTGAKCLKHILAKTEVVLKQNIFEISSWWAWAPKLLCGKRSPDSWNSSTNGHSVDHCTNCRFFILNLVYSMRYYSGPGSSVGIATELRAGRSGIKTRWGRDFPPVQTGPGAHPASCKMDTGSFPGVKCGWGVLLTTPAPSSAAVMED